MSWEASWPSGDWRSAAAEGVGLEGIVNGGGGGVDSLLEWPKERSLNREAILSSVEMTEERER